MSTPREDGKPPVVYFCGPSGSGKSTTLQKLAHTAKEEKNIPVLFISLPLKEPVSIDDPYSFSRDYFILVDDAQNLLNCQEVVAFIRRKGKAIYLSFSPVLVERHGTSTANCPIQPILLYTIY